MKAMIHTSVLTALLVAAASALHAAEAAQPAKPNIVLIYADDLSETKNVAAAHPDIVKLMSSKLNEIKLTGKSRP